MGRGSKRAIYYIGSVILAVLLFLAMFILDEDKSWQVSTETSSSQSVPPPESSSDSSSSSELPVISVDSSTSESSSVPLPPTISAEDSSSSDSSILDSSGDPPPTSSEDSSEEGGNDSTDGGGGGGGGGPDYLFRVKTNQDFYGTMYLREDSLDYYVGNGEHGFNPGDVYYLDDGEPNPLTYFAMTLAANGYEAYTADIELNKIQGEYLPYFPAESLGRTDVKIYSVTYYSYDFFLNGLGGLVPITDPEFIEYEQWYKEVYIDEHYLTIGDGLKTLLLELAAENGIDADADVHTIAVQVANYIQNAAYYSYEWVDKNYPSDVDMVTHFLTEEKAGVCRHFAAAATMMFRALGIPARYVKGFAIPIDGADTWTEWRDAGHAWTEIYIEGYGWIPLEVTGGNMKPDDVEKPEIEDDRLIYSNGLVQDIADPFKGRRYLYIIKNKEERL